MENTEEKKQDLFSFIDYVLNRMPISDKSYKEQVATELIFAYMSETKILEIFMADIATEKTKWFDCFGEFIDFLLDENIKTANGARQAYEKYVKFYLNRTDKGCGYDDVIDQVMDERYGSDFD